MTAGLTQDVFLHVYGIPQGCEYSLLLETLPRLFFFLSLQYAVRKSFVKAKFTKCIFKKSIFLKNDMKTNLHQETFKKEHFALHKHSLQFNTGYKIVTKF